MVIPSILANDPSSNSPAKTFQAQLQQGAKFAPHSQYSLFGSSLL